LTGLNETTKSNDNLHVKVKRHNPNTLSNRIAKWWNGKQENNIFPTPNLEEHTFGCGFLTAQVRRWDEELETYGDWFYAAKDKHNLLTTGGRDFFHQQCYKDSGLGSAGTTFVAVTTSTFTPASGDTTLASEETLHGFARALGTYAHTGGTNATTVTITFTATGAETNLQASALFTASSSGTMSHEATFTPTTFATNDQLQITWTLNLG
jgi:hypothetical protein